MAAVAELAGAGSPSSATSATPSGGRSAGLFESAAIATLSSRGGASGRNVVTGGGGASLCSATAARASSDSKGSRPVSIR